jgi:hypothetical protein
VSFTQQLSTQSDLDWNERLSAGVLDLKFIESPPLAMASE